MLHVDQKEETQLLQFLNNRINYRQKLNNKFEKLKNKNSLYNKKVDFNNAFTIA